MTTATMEEPAVQPSAGPAAGAVTVRHIRRFDRQTRALHVVIMVTFLLLAATGMPILRGRAFDDSDRSGSPLVAIVNQTFVRVNLAGREPVGSRLRILDPACGDGTLLDAAADMFAASRPHLEIELLGFDTDSSAVARAKQLLERWHPHGGVRVSVADFL